jgi:hypothetical protein
VSESGDLNRPNRGRQLAPATKTATSRIGQPD